MSRVQGRTQMEGLLEPLPRSLVCCDLGWLYLCIVGWKGGAGFASLELDKGIKL